MAHLEPPSRIHRRYRVVAPLGRGGLASTYRVWDEAVDDERALKLVDAAAVAPLRHEFSMLAGLEHPHLLRVHDFGLFRQGEALRAFYTADVVPGATLDRYAASTRWSALRGVVVDVLRGLAFLHRVGIRHGDVKPANVIVGPEGQATLIDLSCAARLGGSAMEVSGTEGYLAPELLRGAPGDGRSDLYGVGTMLERLPVALPPDVERLAARMRASDPAARPSEVDDVLAALGVPPEVDVPWGRSPTTVGRHDALAAFDGWCARFVAAAPGVRALTVVGPEGLGKTRLLAEMKWRAQARCEVIEAVGRHADVGAMLAGAGSEPTGPGMEALLDAVQRAAGQAESRLIVADDVDRWRPAARRRLEAMIRALPPDGRLAVVAASRDPLSLDPGDHLLIEATPLDGSAVGAWLGPLVSPAAIPDVMRLTAGHPAYVEAAAREIAAGRLRERDLKRAPRLAADEGIRHVVRDLDLASRRTLARIVAGDRTLDPDAASIRVLQARGLIRRHPSSQSWTLARRADRRALERSIGPDDMRAAFERVAAVATEPALKLVAYLGAGQRERALTLLREPPDTGDEGAYSEGLHVLARGLRDAGPLLECARQQLRLGREDRALSAVARALRARPEAPSRRMAYGLASEACVLSEQPARAARYARRALASAGARPDDAELGALLVRALNQAGNYAEAGRRAAEHLSGLGPEHPARAWLASAKGLASTYLGALDDAEGELEAALGALPATGDTGRAAARIHSYRAILAFRRGDLPRAASAYGAAVGAAERQSLDDMLPTLLLNLATARHQLGDWGDALQGYRRAHRLARGLGKRRAQVILELNLATLYADIGLSDRAAGMLAAVRTTAARIGLHHLDGQAAAVAAETALVEGDEETARQHFERAASIHAARGERREEAEAYLGLARSSRGAPTRARRYVARARACLPSGDAADLDAAVLVVDGLACLDEGRREEAEEAVRRGLERAEGAGQRLAAIEARTALVDVARARGQRRAAEQHAEVAARAWAQTAETLPAPLRASFWRHPRRRTLAPSPPSEARPGEASPSARDAARLRRVLELGARVSSSLSLDRVLAAAMDAAVDLTGAERGFLLLRRDDEEPLTVAVARNLDRENLDRGDLRFSRGIAERVFATGAPVMTLDARGDGRFADHHSVHAMRLEAVAAVPVAARGRVIGALYLDNRIERGRFEEADVGVVMALGSHIAMAVTNAWLHEALAEKHERLEIEKRRVERFSRGQAQQIGALERQVQQQQQVLARRYDYRAIVHRSDAMARVFDVLDRVIESDLTILVEGESGTGKELIARAIHFNSPRAEAPFVSVNCGALSETLLESELFGHVRGAFTGADRDRDGLMVAARGGTLFLDEVGELSLPMQVKLLRALQEREVRPVGATAAQSVDLRVVGATNRHLRDEVEGGRFREDLYYRLAVVELTLPPLRERQADILPIARTLLRRLAERDDAPEPDLDRAAVAALLAHRWPGNVRQLENVLARAYVLSDKQRIRESDLDLRASPRRRDRPTSREAYDQEEATRIHDTLLANGWNVSRTARALGVPRNTLYRKMRRFGLQRE